MKLFFSKPRPILQFLIIAIGIILFLSFLIKQSRPVSINHPDITIIELREDGFHPDSVTIQIGDTVRFVNSSKGFFWPASDSHPVHNGYPEFDSLEPIPLGGSWSFTFGNVGAWGFHDHLSPYLIGKITVVEDSKRIQTQAANCEGDSDAKLKACLQESLLKILNTKGLDKVFDEVEFFYVNNPKFATECHDVMHDIGHKAYKVYLKDKDFVISPKGAYCANGFYHGLMEAFLGANPNLKKASDFCAYVDQKLKDKAPDASLQCYHGIGHGLLSAGFQGGIKFIDEKSIYKPALDSCEKVSNTPEQLYRCASGVFNGIANFYIKGEYGLSVKNDNPFFVCVEQPEKYKESCYGNFNSLIFELSGNSFSKAVQYILNMKEKKYQDMSIKYLSNLATLTFAKTNPQEAIESCRTLGALHMVCIEGFAHGFLEHGMPNVEYQQAIDFCTNKSMTIEESKVCLSYTISGLQGWYSENKTKEICNSINPDFKKYCRMP